MPFEIPPIRQPAVARAERRWRELRVCEYCGRAFAPAGAEVRCPECLARWSSPSQRAVSAEERIAFENDGCTREMRRRARMARGGRRIAARTTDGTVMYCVDCGRAFLAKRANARRCPECRKALNRARNREYCRRWYARKTGKAAE